MAEGDEPDAVARGLGALFPMLVLITAMGGFIAYCIHLMAQG